MRKRDSVLTAKGGIRELITRNTQQERKEKKREGAHERQTDAVDNKRKEKAQPQFLCGNKLMNAGKEKRENNKYVEMKGCVGSGEQQRLL